MSESLVTLHGSVPTNKHARIGPTDPKERVEVFLKLKRQTEDGLPTLQQFINGERSKGISRKELADKYGAPTDAGKAVRQFAKSHGLAVSKVDLGAREAHL